MKNLLKKLEHLKREAWMPDQKNRDKKLAGLERHGDAS